MFSWGILTNESCHFVHLSFYLFCFERKKFLLDGMPVFEILKEPPTNSGI